ncbi:hypothetical protein D3C74_505780 [compost metagenome]
MVAMDGRASGSMILKNTPKSVHPSILADSSRLSGRAWKKFRIMIRLKALTATGMIIDQ